MKILVVEDELALQQSIVDSLMKEMFVVETASDYLSAHEKMAMYDYDVILLDIMLPGGNGLELLKELKKANRLNGVIIISAKNALDDKLAGLELGADDYLTKPFHLAELTARVKAVLRRKFTQGSSIISLGNVALNTDERSLKVGEIEVTLNRKEYDILLFFLVNEKRLITKTALAEHVWGDDSDQADSLDFIYYQIKNLRKKLHEAAAQVEIEAVYGVGYKLVVS